MNRNDFILPVSIIKVQEKKLLTEQKLIKMLETNTSKEIIKILNDTDYSYSMIGITSDEMYENILVNETKRVYNFAREMAKDYQDIVDILALRYEYQNLKLILKNSNSNSNLDDLVIDTGIKNREKLDQNYNLVKNIKDKQVSAIILDKLYFEHIYELAKKMKDFDIFTKYVKILIDKYNVVTFLRLKKQNKNIDYIENIFVENGNISKNELIKIYDNNSSYINNFKKYSDSKVWDIFEKEQNIDLIEKMYDNMVINLARDYRNVTIGPEPIFTYILAKEYEMRALRLILSSKINSINPEDIKGRMRGVYV